LYKLAENRRAFYDVNLWNLEVIGVLRTEDDIRARVVEE